MCANLTTVCVARALLCVPGGIQGVAKQLLDVFLWFVRCQGISMQLLGCSVWFP